ncbi:protein KRI1, putative [Plasmodium vivax]|uniref:Kri1-like C-terminal domain-containing protein n=3 Tax=Plasmodium vivax TaxID=5855 RepID=A5K5J6_PLAVS|nr:hypothetical protein, conserved [Plasmodium vivax]KMZ94428.1 hypothetical protein PVMG_01786 [Plasmodium vivax Mauritania I]EDL45181.1 hypothetical protein, conserved [Plasmodium vivax]CAG9479693.1 unnamed protein product [Plasmodium vivax]CAI7718769.1 protein KRI1, putative [Plasmodium vivax]SCO71244.1 protein KRI1, putative [Plasmodium vivax]|eukprot:XP_001614908.1 hypothetical protein [Plasmodium vivax Sal-1]
MSTTGEVGNPAKVEEGGSKKSARVEDGTAPPLVKEKNETVEKPDHGDEGAEPKNEQGANDKCLQNDSSESAERKGRKKRKIQKGDVKSCDLKSCDGENEANRKGIENVSGEKEDEGTLSSDDKSSSSDEDHDGLLLTSKFKKKFSDLLLKLKSKDASLLPKEGDFFFHDSDFETDVSDDGGEGEGDGSEGGKGDQVGEVNEVGQVDQVGESAASRGSLNYADYFKDILMKEGSHAIDEEEEKLIEKEKEACSQKNKKSYLNEQEELKKKIIEACKIAEEQNENEGDDGNFFTIKEKTEKEILEEKTYYENFLKTSKIVKEEDGLLKEYWNDNLNKDEEFLRDYILKELWREDKIHNVYEDIDEVDDEELDKAAKFEKTYNFRYEEQNGNIINSNPRQIKSSVRIDMRKEKRREKRREKRKRQRERKRKNLTEDLKMEGSKKGKKKESKQDRKRANAVSGEGGGDAEDNDTANMCLPKEEKKKKKKKKATGEDAGTVENSNDMWFLCDECNVPISPLNYVYECTCCDNFAVCKPCFKKITHEHDLKKQVVPLHCAPPKDYQKGNAPDISGPKSNNRNGGEKKYSELEYLENDSSAYEDLIDDMPIRFKYFKVKPETFKLTTDYILKTDDETLNQIVPLHYVSPYFKHDGKAKLRDFSGKKGDAQEKKRPKFNGRAAARKGRGD